MNGFAATRELVLACPIWLALGFYSHPNDMICNQSARLLVAHAFVCKTVGLHFYAQRFAATHELESISASNTALQPYARARRRRGGPKLVVVCLKLTICNVLGHELNSGKASASSQFLRARACCELALACECAVCANFCDAFKRKRS